MPKTIFALAVLFSMLLAAGCMEQQKHRKKPATFPSKDFGGKIWMTRNLALIADRTGQSISPFYPDDNPENTETFGLLYDHETALKICPKGWHLPSAEEWDRLIAFMETQKISNDSTEEACTSLSEFDIQPAGYGNAGDFANLFGSHAIFWSSTNVDTHFVKGYVLPMNNGKLHGAPQHPEYAFSVRCVKD